MLDVQAFGHVQVVHGLSLEGKMKDYERCNPNL